MSLSFEGYVHRALEEKTGLATTNLSRLVRCALADNSIKELVFIYAMLRNKKYHLMSLVWNTPLEEEYRAALRVLASEGSLEAFLQSKRTPITYRRIYSDFLHYPVKAAARKKDDAKQIERLRERTVRALEACNITRYRLCTNLKLNPGNVYAYLSGDVSKVSLATAQKICDYVYELAQQTPQS